MMMNKRLIRMLRDGKKYVAGNVIAQWLSLVANMVLIFQITAILQDLADRQLEEHGLIRCVITAGIVLAVRYLCARISSRMSFLSSKSVKKTLRRSIYEKLMRLGVSYQEKASSSEIVQVAVEGVDQLETYFGSYLPQFFYSLLAPVTLFVALAFVNLPAAVILLICVPLIPGAIMGVQKFAKKLLAGYWGQYTAMGDSFLENLQGLTTLKIYQADEWKNSEMNREAEKFRKITMKVLTMQLNSITIMDLVAYGGAALGIIIGVWQMQTGNVGFDGCLAIILLSAEFFIPMRLLGSFFHIAMNGMAASEKIFRLLDLEEEKRAGKSFPETGRTIRCQDLHFSYEKDREILKGISFEIPEGSFIGVAGESGSGKSTIASILMGRNTGWQGELRIGGLDMSELDEKERMENITYVSYNSYLFPGTVRDNLLMGCPNASEKRLWEVLEQTRLADFLRSGQGLETKLTERGSNFSGGQRQRLALARALLHDSPIYIFDEATSNIDPDSENDLVALIRGLAGEKTVLMISHRLLNVVGADRIYVMNRGKIAEEGTHEELLQKAGIYKAMWDIQQELEGYGKGEAVNG